MDHITIKHTAKYLRLQIIHRTSIQTSINLTFSFLLTDIGPNGRLNDFRYISASESIVIVKTVNVLWECHVTMFMLDHKSYFFPVTGGHG